MGTKAKEIINMDVEEVIGLLNKAFADEWLAFYQYWIGAKVVKGPLRGVAERELEEHAGEEFEHAEKLAERIITLGGEPILKPEEWYNVTNCGYAAPDDPTTRSVIQQNVEGEQCAIEIYNNLIDTVKGKDEVTYKLIVDILEDELEHEEDLQNILEDLEVMGK